jgi:hypothetical protein
VEKLHALETEMGQKNRELDEAKRALAAGGDSLAAEREAHLQHLAYTAVVRVMKREMARGWLTWRALHDERKRQTRMVLGRWQNKAKSMAFRSWFAAYPPTVHERRRAAKMVMHARARTAHKKLLAARSHDCPCAAVDGPCAAVATTLRRLHLLRRG